MKIPKQVFEQIMQMKTRGDVVAIADKLGMSIPPITKAFRTGRCSEAVFKGIIEFYTERQKNIEELSKQLQP